MEGRAVHGGDEARNRPSDVLPPGLANVLADMIISALSWEDAHGIQADRDKNDKDVTGPRCAGVSCDPSSDRDSRVGQEADGDGV